jgi:hypothetical protein
MELHETRHCLSEFRQLHAPFVDAAHAPPWDWRPGSCDHPQGAFGDVGRSATSRLWIWVAPAGRRALGNTSLGLRRRRLHLLSSAARRLVGRRTRCRPLVAPSACRAAVSHTGLVLVLVGVAKFGAPRAPAPRRRRACLSISAATPARVGAAETTAPRRDRPAHARVHRAFSVPLGRSACV